MTFRKVSSAVLLALALGLALPSHALENLVISGRGGDYIPGGEVADPAGLQLRIKKGSTLDYLNLDYGATHSLTSTTLIDGVPIFSSDIVSAQDGIVPVVGVSSLEAGTYRFYCVNHNGITGNLRVEP